MNQRDKRRGPGGDPQRRGVEPPPAWSSGGSYGHPHEEPFDPDYDQWRSEQMRSLDDDYRAWRNDRYKRFAEEFNAWRNKRSAGSGGDGGSGGKPTK